MLKVPYLEQIIAAIVDGTQWTTARTNAQNLGGDLVVIDSSSENDFLVANFHSEITIDSIGRGRS